MMKTNLILFFVFILFISCKKDEPNEEKNIFDARIDLSGAKAVFKTVQLEGNNFYKITNENTIENIEIINTDGSTIYENPTENNELSVDFCLKSSNFLFVDFINAVLWNSKGEQINENGVNVIVKETGEIKNIGNESAFIWYYQYLYLNNNNIQNSYDAFYFSDNERVYKIDSSFSTEQYSPVGKQIINFRVNSAGYMLYNVHNDNEYSLKSPSGSIFSISDHVIGNITGYWLGTDDKFYLCRYNTETHQYSIDKVTIDNSDVNISTIVDVVSNGFFLNNFSFFKVEFANTVLFINKYYNSESKIFYENIQSINNTSNILPEFDEVVDVDQSAEYFYVATKNNIYKFDLSFQYNKLFDSEDYDFYAMCVDANNNVIFNALRNSDGKVVIGEINSKGSINIIDDKLNKEFDCLEFL